MGVVPYGERKDLLNALTSSQQRFVENCVPTFLVVLCLELNAVYIVVSTRSYRPRGPAVPLPEYRAQRSLRYVTSVVTNGT